MSAVPLTLHPRVHHWAESQANAAGLTLSAWIEQQLVRLVNNTAASLTRAAEQKKEIDHAYELAESKRDAIRKVHQDEIDKAVRIAVNRDREQYRKAAVRRIERRYMEAIADAFDTTVDVIEDMMNEAAEVPQ